MGREKQGVVRHGQEHVWRIWRADKAMEQPLPWR